VKPVAKGRIYIAYGSNLNLMQMAQRCPTAVCAGKAVLNHYELVFRAGRNGGVATIQPKEGSCVPALLWQLKPKDEASLDIFEGHPVRYTKRMMEVQLGGRDVSAIVYVKAPGHEAAYPSETYLNLIAEGYESAGFDPEILDAALKRTEEIMAEETAQRAAETEQVFDLNDQNFSQDGHNIRLGMTGLG
jgi:hypothetical protein